MRKNNKIKKDNIPIHYADGTPVTWCLFCGAKVGQISERTDKKVTAVYYCPKCWRNYCDQCSYSKEINGNRIQLCLRCDFELEKIPV